jgi:hypothetical protein
MSQRLHYAKTHSLSKLHDELLAAGIAPERVEGKDGAIWITVADGVSEAAVAAVVGAHRPETTRPRTDEEYRAEYHALTTTDARRLEIMAILLGLTPRDRVLL